MPGPGRPFPKGQSGNPAGKKPGTPNKSTREVREWARAILEDPQVRERTLAQARLGRLAPAVLIELMNRAYGKVKDAVDMDQRGTFQFIQVIKHPKDGGNG